MTHLPLILGVALIVAGIGIGLAGLSPQALVLIVLVATAVCAAIVFYLFRRDANSNSDEIGYGFMAFMVFAGLFLFVVSIGITCFAVWLAQPWV